MFLSVLLWGFLLILTSVSASLTLCGGVDIRLVYVHMQYLYGTYKGFVRIVVLFTV